MRRLLCYGDSNTYGVDPDTGLRFDESHRWPCVLARGLGPGWHVVEEGLCGRNSGLDDPVNPVRNGRTFLPVVLASHRPLDWVVVMLGSNDFKSCFQQSAEAVAERVVGLATYIASFDYGPYPAPRVLVVAPVRMERAALLTGKFDEESLCQNARFPETLRSRCRGACLPFLDASRTARAGSDGQHLDAHSHILLAQRLLPFLDTDDGAF